MRRPELESLPRTESKWHKFLEAMNADTTGTVEVPPYDPRTSNKFSWKKLWRYMGPGFLISIAYIDPGNIETDVQAGAQYKYQLIWLMFFATLLGLVLQILAARLGIVSQRHLSRVCRDDYGTKSPLTISMWLITELAIVASDIPEVIGSAIALDLLFHLPLWIGVILTGLDTMLLLGIQYFGIRKLEGFVASLVGIMSLGFIAEVFLTPHVEWIGCWSDYACGGVLNGLVPRLQGGSNVLYIGIGLLGAVVMPHNLFLHSALVQSRKIEKGFGPVKEANKYFAIESALSLLISAIINTSIIIVAGSAFFGLPDVDKQDIGLYKAYQLFKNIIGSAAPAIYGIALLASGQSSTLTGTYAGQFVMEGFIDIRLPTWKRNLITRSVAIVPSLLVTLIVGRSGAEELIVISSVVLSVQLPFALIPLVRFTSSEKVMGPFAMQRWLRWLSWVLASIVIVANIYLIIDATLIPMLDKHTATGYVVSVVICILLLVYVCLIIHLIRRPASAVYAERLSDLDDPDCCCEQSSVSGMGRCQSNASCTAMSLMGSVNLNGETDEYDPISVVHGAEYGYEEARPETHHQVRDFPDTVGDDLADRSLLGEDELQHV